MARWVWPTAAGVVTSATGVVINVATDRADSLLAWVGVVLLTALGVGIGIAAQRADLRHREAARHDLRPTAPAAPPATPPAATPPAAAPPAAAPPAAAPPAAAPPAATAPAATAPAGERAAAGSPDPAHAPPPEVPRSVYNHHQGNTSGPVIQVGYLHGNLNQGNTVDQSATAHGGSTIHQAGRDVRLDRDR
ncbi:hypothetical protein GCM10010492_31720 [Saccharothrix mutabilis subsp. mutabilis]|uniref:Uncharacterized protein n=1 Tax=Saccharothrix mutabilis subsp. mutabilis TaxID=66855 RepID=A0ABN0TUS9_9PSEU